MTRKPLINITAGKDCSYALEGKRLVVMRWPVGGVWWVAAPGAAPHLCETEQDSVRVFMDHVMGATS